MTTFTKLSEDATPSISIDTDRILSPIADEIYSGFTEHMGRCIYGGLYEPGSSLSDSNGFRTDVIEAFKELNMPVVRYPGGNFVATYHWTDGIGPVSSRPKRPELAWNGIESNEFGTDEFMKWCDVVGTRPYIALNMGTGTLDEAMAWVEYCNGTKDTYWANKRRENGHEEPYNVKYWSLGNECYGEWQVEQAIKEDYAKKAYQWAKALKCRSVSSGRICTQFISTLTQQRHLPNASGPLSAERSIEICAALIDMARIRAGVTKPVTICFDEWNIWDPERAPGDKGAEELYNLSDMLALGVWCNVFIRKSKYLGMTNIAQSVNVISPLMTTEDGLVKQTTWWPYLLFAKYMRGYTLGTHVSCGTYDGRTTPAWIQSTLDVPWLDVSAALNDGYVNLAVVNLHPEKSFETKLKGLAEGTNTKVYLVTGNSLEDVNTASKTTVEIQESSWTAGATYTFPKHSFTLLRWKA